MIRVHREPLVPLSLFDFRHVPGRDEERNDNARTSPTVEDESESGRRDVPARRCGGYRIKGFAQLKSLPSKRSVIGKTWLVLQPRLSFFRSPARSNPI